MFSTHSRSYAFNIFYCKNKNKNKRYTEINMFVHTHVCAGISGKEEQWILYQFFQKEFIFNKINFKETTSFFFFGYIEDRTHAL